VFFSSLKSINRNGISFEFPSSLFFVGDEESARGAELRAPELLLQQWQWQ